MENSYVKNSRFQINPGFICKASHVLTACQTTNKQLRTLPYFLFEIVDYKITSAIIGRLFCENLAKEVKALVNPIEKGHPDIIPARGRNASEKHLRNYSKGIEVKVTVGNVQTGKGLRTGQPRIDHLSGITWQAHHREVKELMGLVWDFDPSSKNYPMITGIFYSNRLIQNDWGMISGTTGRNTKVTAMLTSGKNKMGDGYIIIVNDKKYLEVYQRILDFKLSK
jgi:hypothetical protein